MVDSECRNKNILFTQMPAESAGDMVESSEMKTEVQDEKPKDKSKPVSSTPVPGSPWCVVWTGDGKQFFYNPSKRMSVWETPEDLTVSF